MTGQAGNLIAIVRTPIEYFEDKSILTFVQCQSFIPENVVAFRVRTEYTSFVHVSVLIILGNCDHFAFRPITSHNYQSSCRYGLSVPSQRNRIINGFKLSHLSVMFLGDPNF